MRTWRYQGQTAWTLDPVNTTYRARITRYWLKMIARTGQFLPKGTKVGISHTHSLCFSSFWELPDLPRKPPLIGRSPPHPTRLSHIQNVHNATTSRLVPFHSLVLLSYSSSLRLATYAFDIVSRSLTSVRPPFDEVRSVPSFVKAP